MIALTQIATHPDHYKKVLPVLLDKTSKFTVDSASYKSSSNLKKVLVPVPPLDVQERVVRE